MFAAAGCLLAGALLLNPAGVLAQHSVVGGKPAATGKAAAAHVMALEEKYADMGTAIKLVKNGDKDLSAYLSDPDNECTVFLPTSQAGCSCSMRQLCVWCGGQCVCVCYRLVWRQHQQQHRGGFPTKVQLAGAPC